MKIHGYLFTGSVALFSGILGFVQWQLGHTARGLWIFTISLAAMIGLYVPAHFGRKLGAAQTFRLHRIYESAPGKTVKLH